MSPIVLLAGASTFLVAMLVHVAIWRLVRVRKEILGLFAVFLIAAPLLQAGFGAWRNWSWIEHLAVQFVYWSLAAAYVQTYPALKADIPTFRILLHVHRRGRDGADFASITAEMGQQEELYLKKVTELEGDALVVRRDGRLALTWAGAMLARVVLFYRRMWGLGIGMG